MGNSGEESSPCQDLYASEDGQGGGYSIFILNTFITLSLNFWNLSINESIS